MSVRSKWCEFDKETSKYIKKRDKESCVVCGFNGATQIMHIFVNRSHGGKGSKENGCLGCVKCHRILDNAIGKEENELSKKYNKIVKDYLIEKENITYNKEFISSLKFKKDHSYTKIDFDPVQANRFVDSKICKNCEHISKIVSNSSTINTYYCKIQRKQIPKKGPACDKYRSKMFD